MYHDDGQMNVGRFDERHNIIDNLGQQVAMQMVQIVITRECKYYIMCNITTYMGRLREHFSQTDIFYQRAVRGKIAV